MSTARPAPRITGITGLAATMLLTLLCSGCLVAAGAAAGSGIYLTTRGAEAVVHGDVPAVAEATRQAFETLGVDYTGAEEQDDGERELHGKTDEADVTVELASRTENATSVEVRVRKSAVTWDKEMARSILEQIRGLRGG